MGSRKRPRKSSRCPRWKRFFKRFSSRAFLDIELKVAGLEQQTIATLRKHPPRRGYVVSSFLPDVLRATNDLDGNVPLGLLCENRHQLPTESRAPRFARGRFALGRTGEDARRSTRTVRDVGDSAR